MITAYSRAVALVALLVFTGLVQATPDALLQQIRKQHAAHGPVAAMAVAQGFGLLLREAAGQPLVSVIVDRSVTRLAGFQGRLSGAGGRLDAVSSSYARLLVPLARLSDLIDAFPNEHLRAPFPAMPVFGLGNALSESVGLTAADGYQAGNLDGTGTKVAVVDLGFAQLGNALAAGELPQTACDAAHSQDFTGTGLTTGTKHGTGVAEHVADMAPGAELYCLKIDDQVGLQNAAAYLKTHGIRIANHSVAWVLASYYDDTGAINAIINTSHDSDGVFWSVAAGNAGQKHWRGTWADTDSDNWLEFATGDELMGLTGTAATVTVFLNWDQYGASTMANLDLYVVDTNGNTVASSTDVQGSGYDPAEAVSFSYQASQAPYSVKIRRAGGNAAGLDITMFSFDHNFEYSTATSSLMDPADAHGAFSVGAVNQTSWTQVNPPIRTYSSRGPTNDGRLKPDLVAPDGTTSFTYGVSNGTSFSAPTVAGATALLLQEDPLQDAVTLGSRLVTGAIDIGAAGPDTVYGAGKLQLPLIDSDSDGLSNVAEIQLGTDALDPDTDGDTLSDGDEVYTYGTDPLATDTDGDQFNDNAEVLAGTDPTSATSFPGDGDLTVDGVVDIRDMLLGLRYLKGLTALTTPQQVHGDVTQDGMVNLGDLVVIQGMVLNLP